MTTQPTFRNQSPFVTNLENKVGYVDNTDNAPGNYGAPLVLNSVFELLLDMLNSLQHTAQFQANRLNILTAWQQAYTTQMNGIHVFVANNGDGTQLTGASATSVDDPTDTTASAVRSDLNKTNSNWTQVLQGNNGVVSNDAKALQSEINQTNDAVQSQTDMATSLLQTMSTILTSIYQAA
jgi:hypothetical protein